MTETSEPITVSVAEAKRRFSELLGRVSFGGARVVILRRGKPMAVLVPPGEAGPAPHLADVEGWLEEDDPFFDLADLVVRDRARHLPRVLGAARRGRRSEKGGR